FFGSLREAIYDAPAPVQVVGQAFMSNLRGVGSMLLVPIQMTADMVVRQGLQAFSTAQEMQEKQQQKEVLRADKTWWEDQELQDAASGFLTTVLHELRMSIKGAQVSIAAAELLRQGVILTWSSLEVFVRDFFVVTVNSRTELAVRLVEANETRKLFEMKNVPFTVLASYEFNVQSRLGELLAAQYDLDSIPAMKAVFNVLYPTNLALRDALDNRALWTLAQRRNLIVHRRSIVD